MLSRRQHAVRVRLGRRARGDRARSWRRCRSAWIRRRPVHTLAAGEKQKLEILKQLYLGSTIVILDEPTSVLTPAEADEVLGLLRGMVEDGHACTVLMISHKFREVMQFADEVTVLRRGRHGGPRARRRPDPGRDGAHDGGRRAAARHRDARGARARADVVLRDRGADARTTTWACPRCASCASSVRGGRDRRHRRRVGQRPGGAGRGAGRPAPAARRGRSSVDGGGYQARRARDARA